MRESSGIETAGLVPLIHSIRSEPCSAYRKICIAWVGGAKCGTVSGSTFQTAARSATWASFCQLRKPGRSPLAPHSRVFWAVGWPFIWSRPAPGRPSMPRIRCRLLTWTAAAVAWWDW